MKKVAFVLLLACVIMGVAFAQAKPATPAPAPAPAQPKAPAPAPAASAAKSGKANAIGGDAFQLVKGLIAFDSSSKFSSYDFVFSYERLISPHFSIGGDFDIYFFSYGSGSGSLDGKYFNLAFEGRYYPSSESFDKIFVGTTLGYSQLSIDGSSKSEYGGFSGLNTSLKIGYKYLTEKGFFMEPSMSYVLQKTSNYYPGIAPLGWNGGLRLGYAF